MGLVITLSGIPAYYMGVVREKKPAWFEKINGTLAMARLHPMILTLPN